VSSEHEGGATAASGPDDVLAFWREAGPDRWFNEDADFDSAVAARFCTLWQAAANGKLSTWEETPASALALTIVLDQFPRNMFRGNARSYASDALARAVAERAVARGFDGVLPHAERQFLYLPYMHSEKLSDQERCLELARAYGDDEFTRYAELHADIIGRFGRFPHRNTVLGRITTVDEQAFLDGGGFAG
jgi:uncharacterized protein (DUF924 family)